MISYLILIQTCAMTSRFCAVLMVAIGTPTTAPYADVPKVLVVRYVRLQLLAMKVIYYDVYTFKFHWFLIVMSLKVLFLFQDARPQSRFLRRHNRSSVSSLQDLTIQAITHSHPSATGLYRQDIVITLLLSLHLP